MLKANEIIADASMVSEVMRTDVTKANVEYGKQTVFNERDNRYFMRRYYAELSKLYRSQSNVSDVKYNKEIKDEIDVVDFHSEHYKMLDAIPLYAKLCACATYYKNEHPDNHDVLADIAINHLLEEYLKRYNNEQTYAKYQSDIKKFISWSVRNKFTDIDNKTITNYMDYIAGCKDSFKSFQNHLLPVLNFSYWLSDCGKIEPVEHFKLRDEFNARQKASFTNDELDALSKSINTIIKAFDKLPRKEK